MKKEEELITSFIWCGATVCVYTQVVKFAGTTIQRHLLPTNLRRAVQQAVNQAVEKAAQAECLAVDSPRHVQQNRRRVRNEEQQHYGVTARALQRRARSSG
ncbi:hypothetical protein LIN35_22375 [Klebsiella pneumoniae]|uniref:hypothetical protein n=1 Tax=Klebsiella pneumoniae TaxID=573 RepID=UPI0013CBD7C7|nr:hypothetical protein [Klebsiella pneumoniae]EIV3895297.1 hypothetical protein [Klebsiella pneumoniae]MDC7841366.1 hypothetical protein [Klebsiella pneumoniae]MDQ4672366.1 hypothetical protein [Klebsiella pneumoniae]MDQ5246870.1 hypothetical protein [Klebsiella pneumoniae]MEB7443674.1 hypothetical protein [Klebsiella pneumoniae]